MVRIGEDPAVLISKDAGRFLEANAMFPYVQFSFLDIPLKKRAIQQKQLMFSTALRILIYHLSKSIQFQRGTHTNIFLFSVSHQTA
jgi:hypothetical protein